MELAITPDLILIQTTVDSLAVADVLMKRVINERAAACAALSASATSHYRWRGQIETTTEWYLTFKTRRELFGRVADLIRAHHPYETPEIIAIPVLEADPAYAAWILTETDPREM